jgi:hypothetical protein
VLCGLQLREAELAALFIEVGRCELGARDVDAGVDVADHRHDLDVAQAQVLHQFLARLVLVGQALVIRVVRQEVLVPM